MSVHIDAASLTLVISSAMQESGQKNLQQNLMSTFILLAQSTN